MPDIPLPHRHLQAEDMPLLLQRQCRSLQGVKTQLFHPRLKGLLLAGLAAFHQDRSTHLRRSASPSHLGLLNTHPHLNSLPVCMGPLLVVSNLVNMDLLLEASMAPLEIFSLHRSLIRLLLHNRHHPQSPRRQRHRHPNTVSQSSTLSILRWHINLHGSCW